MEVRDRDCIAEQAIDFRNRYYFGYNAAVHLEDAEDELFWNTLLQKVQPGRYDFIYYSRSKSGNETRGCEQCLRYQGYLDHRFFICIDSDLRHLLAEADISAKHYIAQTYTYSWENHYCFAERLQQKLLDKCPDVAGRFDFCEFLKAYSNAVYIPFLFLLHLKRNSRPDGFEREFNRRLLKQCSAESLAGNGSRFIKSLKDNLTELCESHPLWPAFDVKGAESLYGHSAITEDNAYLYVRGHNVFDLIAYIGHFLCFNTGISFEEEVLVSVLDGGCSDLERVKEDLRHILTH